MGGFDEPVVPAGGREVGEVGEVASEGEVTERSYDEPAGGREASHRGNGALEARVAALEAEVADLKAQLADLLE